MADQNLEWMTEGPLDPLGALHKMPKRAEIINIKFNHDSIVKAKDHLENFYLQLQTLEVRYDEVACRFFPCTLDGRAAV